MPTSFHARPRFANFIFQALIDDHCFYFFHFIYISIYGASIFRAMPPDDDFARFIAAAFLFSVFTMSYRHSLAGGPFDSSARRRHACAAAFSLICRRRAQQRHDVTRCQADTKPLLRRSRDFHQKTCFPASNTHLSHLLEEFWFSIL